MLKKLALGPVKLLEDWQNLDFPCVYQSSSSVKVQKFSQFLEPVLFYNELDPRR